MLFSSRPIRATSARFALARLVVALLVAACGAPLGAEPPTSTSFVLAQGTVASAGETMTSTSFFLDGSLAQPATVGETTSTSWVVQSGFWTGLATRRVVRIAGDGSGDGSASGEGVACELDAGAASGDCSRSFTDGEIVSFLAMADPTHAFDAWSGCDATSTTHVADDTCEVVVGDGRTVTARFTALGIVTGRVWRDVDGDGLQDPSEHGLHGVSVTIDDGAGMSRTVVTAADGFYRFGDVPPGTYDVSIDPLTLPAGVTASYDLDGTGTPHAVETTLAPGETRADVDFGYQPMIDLAITKDDSADPLPGGQRLVYALTVQNLGPSDATGVVITDNLPAATTLVATSGCAEDPVGIPSCTVGGLAYRDSAVVTVEVSVDPAPPASITNVASVSAAEADTDAGNDSDDETTTLDADPPAVSLVDSEETTDDGEVTECETIHARSVERLLVQFDESMADAAGDSDAGDVTNPESWLLVSAGDDRTLDTTACGPPAGDDEEVALSSVSYDSGSMTATLEVPGVVLDSALYRLFACGTGTSVLADLAGNPLDGDGNSVGGDDFVLRFRADSRNELANGHFDCDLGDWVLVSTNPSEIVYGIDDVDASPDSGSAAVKNLTDSNDFALGQCAAVEAEETYQLTARVRMATGADNITVATTCSFYDAADCGGAQVGTPTVSAFVLADTGGSWVSLGGEFDAPDHAFSALCSVDLATSSGARFEADIDQIRLMTGDEIFADGFESGDTSSWSTRVP